MQFVVTAIDYKDTDALNRRLAMREQHIANLKKLHAKGQFHSGGALLDDSNKMIGSSIHVSFNNQKELEDWLNQDAYVTGKVWETINIKSLKLFQPD